MPTPRERPSKPAGFTSPLILMRFFSLRVGCLDEQPDEQATTDISGIESPDAGLVSCNTLVDQFGGEDDHNQVMIIPNW